MTDNSTGRSGRRSGYDVAVRWTVAHLEGVDGAFRQDLLATMDALAQHAGRARRIAELASLVALGWRLRSRARTGRARRAQWRQGAYLGGVLLGVVLAAASWSAAADHRPASGGLTSPWMIDGSLVSALGWVGAVGATGAVYCGLAGCRPGAVAWSGLAMFLGPLAASSSAAVPAIIAGYLVMVTAMVLGDPGPVRRCRVAALVLAAVPATSVALVVFVGPATADRTLYLALSVVGPALLLAAGHFDPRLAMAGTVIWFWRLAASAVAELAEALAVFTATGDDNLLLRWLLMSSGVVLAAGLTRGSVRRLSES